MDAARNAVDEPARPVESPPRHVGCRPGPPSHFHPALWHRAISRTWVQLLVSAVVLMVFGWVFVWLMSLLPSNAWADLMERWMPDMLKRAFGEDLALFATKPGQVSVVYRHLLTMLVCVGWAVARGSDAVSGEIARGTMEHLLALPVRRVVVLVVPSVVATLGAAVLAAATWAGASLGLMTVERFEDLSPLTFLPGAVNLFAMTFCMAGITTLLSSMDHDRWRTIWYATGVFVVAFIVFMVAFLWPAGWPLKWCTFLTAFQPQTLILKPHQTWTLPLGPLGGLTWPVAVWYNGVLAVLGLACYAVAAVIFVRRDIPIPR